MRRWPLTRCRRRGMAMARRWTVAFVPEANPEGNRSTTEVQEDGPDTTEGPLYAAEHPSRKSCADLLCLGQVRLDADLPDGTIWPAQHDSACLSQSKWAQLTQAVKDVVAATGRPFAGDEGIFRSRSMWRQRRTACPIADDWRWRSRRRWMPAASGATPTREALLAGGRYLSVLTDLNPSTLFWPRGLPNCARHRPHSVAGRRGEIAAIHDIVATNIPRLRDRCWRTGRGSGHGIDGHGGAGGESQKEAPRYFPASNTSQIVKVLNTISSATSSCLLRLVVRPSRPDDLVVTGRGVSIHAIPLIRMAGIMRRSEHLPNFREPLRCHRRPELSPRSRRHKPVRI